MVIMKSADKRRLLRIVQNMEMLVQSLDELDAPISAAHLDRSIEALCKQFEIERYASDMDEV